jgi:hypothetical protein
MAADDQLRKALGAIDGNALIAEFLADPATVTAVAQACERLALWTNALRGAEPENAAIPFLMEMQRSSHDVAALLSTALYVPAAAAMRTACETALYYTFFRSHPAELTTLATDSDYFISKQEILDFHKQHSPLYRKAAREFGFPGGLNKWYSSVSAIVHGQIPGTWGRRLALEDTKHEPAVLKAAVKTLCDGVEVTHILLLLTAGAELWGRFHHEAKRALLKGMPVSRRTLLGLDGR